MPIKKSQITMEFLVSIGLLFIFSLGFILAAGVQIKEFSDEKKIKTINDFGDSIRTELELASVVKKGYKRELTLPQLIDSSIDYTIVMSNSTLIINTENHEFNAIIPKTGGELKKGANIIRNINNSVFVENV